MITEDKKARFILFVLFSDIIQIVKFMLTRSKIKMEESFKEIHENNPTYAHDDPYQGYQGIRQVQSGNINAPYPTQEARYTSYKTTFTEESRPQAARN